MQHEISMDITLEPAEAYKAIIPQDQPILVTHIRYQGTHSTKVFLADGHGGKQVEISEILDDGETVKFLRLALARSQATLSGTSQRPLPTPAPV